MKLLARSKDSSKSLAIRVLKNPKSLPWILKGIGKIIIYELKKLCSKSSNSLLRSKEKEHIHTFPWEALYEEFCSHCPTLVSFLASVTDSQSGSCDREKNCYHDTLYPSKVSLLKAGSLSKNDIGKTIFSTCRNIGR